MAEFREMAAQRSARPRSTAGAVAVVVLWIAVAALILFLLWRNWRS
jgi:threonine/homoserine efflux transporter RhtA